MGTEGGEEVGAVYDTVGGVDEGKIGCGFECDRVGVGALLENLSRTEIGL